MKFNTLEELQDITNQSRDEPINGVIQKLNSSLAEDKTCKLYRRLADGVLRRLEWDETDSKIKKLLLQILGGNPYRDSILIVSEWIYADDPTIEIYSNELTLSYANKLKIIFVEYSA